MTKTLKQLVDHPDVLLVELTKDVKAEQAKFRYRACMFTNDNTTFRHGATLAHAVKSLSDAFKEKYQ